MQLLIYLFTGLLLASTNFLIFEENKKTYTFLKSIFTYVIGFNIVSLGVIKYILKKGTILNPESYNLKFSLKYMILTLFLGIIFLTIKGIINSKISLKKATTEFNRKSILIKVLCTIAFMIGMTFVLFSNWFIDYVGQITPEQFLFNLKSPLKGTSSDMTFQIINVPLAGIIFSTTLFIIFINFGYDVFVEIKNSSKKIISQKLIKITSIFLSIVVLIGGVSFGSKKLSLPQVLTSYLSTSNYFEENYVSPNDVKLTFPEKKRNLIHIYYESVETSYFSKELGGYMDENLMPELTELAKEGIHFSNNETFGGANQTYGSSWSVAGMVNMTTGIPLKIPMDGNSYGNSGYFLPGAINLGDILDEEGYNQTVMFGADADFGGLTTFFTSHGNYNIFDVKFARDNGFIPKDYNVWWGFEDDKLYEFAKYELTRLNSEGKPFNFIVENADTHFPDGYLSPGVENKYDSQYANVIAHSSKEMVKFIRWIQEQPFYKDTTIVITGDHLSMDQKFFENFDPNYRRSTFNLILNSPITTENTQNREFAPYDMFPTILASMGVKIEGNKLAMGTNLFSDEKTLIERDGIDNSNYQFSLNSNYFNDEFISEDKNSLYIPKK